MTPKPLYFATTEDFGNYASLRISEVDNKLVVEEGYLPGYKRDSREEPKAYEYSLADINDNTVIGTEPTTLHRIIGKLQGHPDLDRTLLEGVNKAEQVLKEEAECCTFYVNAQYLKHLANSPQFDHKHIPQAFEAAINLAEHKYVKEPILAYFEPVIEAVKEGVTLEAVAQDDMYSLQAFKMTSKFGIPKKEIIEASDFLEEAEFSNAVENIASMMELEVIPKQDWFLENRPGIDI